MHFIISTNWLLSIKLAWHAKKNHWCNEKNSATVPTLQKFRCIVFFQISPKECPVQHCNSCSSAFQEVRDVKVYQCPDCRSIFCCDCDLFFHEVLHSCSGCISINEKILTDNSEKPSLSGNSIVTQNGSHATRKIVTTNGVP